MDHNSSKGLKEWSNDVLLLERNFPFYFSNLCPLHVGISTVKDIFFDTIGNSSIPVTTGGTDALHDLVVTRDLVS